MQNGIEPHAARGQAMVETVVILFALLLLLLGTIQFGLIYNAKITLNEAAFEAARAGALNHADRAAIEYGLARGLAPLYTSVPADASPREQVARVQAARDRVLDEIRHQGFACIQRISPDESAFQAYGIPGRVGDYVGPLIPNDHLRYRSNRTGFGTDVSIQDANLLKLRITYCYPLYVPLISRVLQQLYGLVPDPDPPTGWQPPEIGHFRTACLAAGRIPIVAQAMLRMQTAAKDDEFAASCD